MWTIKKIKMNSENHNGKIYCDPKYLTENDLWDKDCSNFEELIKRHKEKYGE